MNQTDGDAATTRSPGATRERPPDADDTGPTLPRKEREIRRHRRELLEASESLLARKRFHEITVQDISMESEFSVGYIYKLFPNKDEILAALIRAKLADLRLLVEDGLGVGGTWAERLLSMLEALFKWLDETPAYRSAVIPDLNVFARTHPAVAADLSEFTEFFDTETRRLIAEALRLGKLAEEEPGMIARTLLALVSGFSENKLAGLHPGETPTNPAPLIVDVIKRAFAPEGGDL
jgi:AcrR family transcriptional regulator